jgi:multidrug efflux pump subunit AcrA (membrane-fusion protein)
MQSPDDEEVRSNSRWAIGLVLIVLVCGMGFGLAYLSRERKQLNDLAAANQSLHAALDRTQAQLRTFTEQLNERTAVAPVTPRAAAPNARTVATRPRTATRVAAIDPRVKQLQSQLAEQQKQLDSSREDLTKTREDLETKVNSTHDELSGSIARTHDEVAELQRRGERNYYEFKLDKTKDFQRVGPFSVSLRKVNFKRKSYDLAMIVDDNQLQKKSVNLYEPVWIRVGDHPQPAELVVNQISKNQIQGYISEPKYKQSAFSEKNPALTPQ